MTLAEKLMHGVRTVTVAAAALAAPALLAGCYTVVQWQPTHRQTTETVTVTGEDTVKTTTVVLDESSNYASSNYSWHLRNYSFYSPGWYDDYDYGFYGPWGYGYGPGWNIGIGIDYGWRFGMGYGPLIPWRAPLWRPHQPIGWRDLVHRPHDGHIDWRPHDGHYLPPIVIPGSPRNPVNPRGRTYDPHPGQEHRQEGTRRSGTIDGRTGGQQTPQREQGQKREQGRTYNRNQTYDLSPSRSPDRSRVDNMPLVRPRTDFRSNMPIATPDHNYQYTMPRMTSTPQQGNSRQGNTSGSGNVVTNRSSGAERHR